MPHVISPLSRRRFLFESLAAASAFRALGPASLTAAPGKVAAAIPVVVFSKVFQVLSLNYSEAASLASEASLAGLDVPVRPKGEVEPERVADDLPRYARILRQHELTLPLITTAITSISSPHAEAVLRTASNLGIRFYRVGFIDRENDLSKQISQAKAQLKDLAALNQELGLTALLQNHSPAGHMYLGGDLNELASLVAGFDPAQIAIAFDIGHALIVHKEQWREHFEKIKTHLKIAYVKDAAKNGRWVPFGQGELGSCGYFKLLRELHYQAPISMHLEYDWHQNGKSKNRATLLAALKQSAGVLHNWLEQD